MVDNELKCQEQVAGERPFLLQEVCSGREGLFCFRAGEEERGGQELSADQTVQA